MSRLGGVLAACAVSVSLGPAVPSVAVSDTETISLPQVAREFARMIRRDAHQVYRHAKRRVTVALRPNGIRVLRVHYSANIFEGTGHADYVLSAESKQGTVVGVLVEQYSYEAGFYPGGAHWFRSLAERFRVHDGSARFPGRWVFSGEAEAGNGHADAPPGPAQAVSSLTICSPRARQLPRQLYNELLVFLFAAKHHVRSGLPSPSSYC